MDILPDKKRLFFGFEVHAPWPEELPAGRLLAEKDRHMTVAFLGDVSYQKVISLLTSIPKPPLKVGLAGYFDRCLLLPERHPHVVAWHQQWWDESTTLQAFQSELIYWLQGKGFSFSHPDSFLPHVTVCRAPFLKEKWLKSFVSLPFYIKDFHLYESLGSLTYKPIWSYPLMPPFEELEHTADIAYLIRGDSVKQIHRHAHTALAFRFPSLLPYFSEVKEVSSLDDVVIALNECVTRIDEEIGCPFKAVSFHGDLLEDEHGLKWEMIVDV